MEEVTAEFLCKASRVVPSSVLRCHYLSKCRSMEEVNDVVLPSKLFRTSVTCRFCSNIFATGGCNIIVMPEKKPGRKMKKIIHKNEESPALLSLFEKKLLEKCKKDKDNRLVLRCLVCKKITSFPLSKPAKLMSEIEKLDEIETPVMSRKKKKRKKKDIYAGLNKSIVSACTPKRNSVSSPKSQKINDSSIATPLITPKRKIAKSNISIPAFKSPSLHNKSLNESINSALSVKSKQDREIDSTTPKLTVREQIQNAKLQIAASKKDELQRKKMEASNSAKKAKKRNTLKNVLGRVTSTSSPKPSLKDFFASLG